MKKTGTREDTWKLSGQYIVVVDNGFVYHGDVHTDNEFLMVSRAVNIRRYGTDKGLGSLRTGPTSETKCDDCGSVIIPKGRICHLIPATWKR